MRKILLAVAAAASIAALGGAASASASVNTVTAHTYVSDHPDTTNVSGGACDSTITPNGPVWALDRYQSHMTAVQTGASTWQVTLKDEGHFNGFADPTTCAAMVSRGDLIGLYELTVTSATAPSDECLSPTYAGNVGTGHMVADFFCGKATVILGGDYFFSYQDGNYVQNTSGEFGDVLAGSHGDHD